jgi:hypothetical protein
MAMTELVSAQEELLPTESDIRFYREHGWYRSRNIFTDDEIDAALAETERFYAGHRDGYPPVELKEFLDWRPEYGTDRLRMNDYIVFQDNLLRDLCLRPVIGAIAARLAGTRQIRLFNSSMAYKPPQVDVARAKVGWHNDRAYWQTCTSDEMLTAWIPLHDCDETMGTITMIDGSNRWSDDPATASLRRGKTFITDDFDALETQIRETGLPVELIPVSLRKGEVSFHHCLTFHGSGVNRSERPRQNLIVHLQDELNEYRDAVADDGEPIVYNNDQIVRRRQDGRPDYSDPDVCPIIWEE